jgi:hypothetical protein
VEIIELTEPHEKARRKSSQEELLFELRKKETVEKRKRQREIMAERKKLKLKHENMNTNMNTNASTK